MKKIIFTIYIAILSITGTIAQNVSVSEAENLIVGTWYRDFSTYSEPQNIVSVDTTFKIIYDQDYIYYYKNNVLVNQCWYEIRNTDCDNNSYTDRSYIVDPDLATDEEFCSLILNITEEELVLTNDVTGKIYRYVKNP